jgi:3-phosphoshikimate 1-carboxyvinyltransferase
MTLILQAPGSKSMTQRALVLGALAEGPVRIRGALDCDDSGHLTEILRALGAEVTWRGSEVEVRPHGLRGTGERLECGNAGTALRFAACLSLVAGGELVLDGDARMRQRPVAGLGEALRRLGVEVRYLGNDGYPPLALRRISEPPDAASVEASRSSQFASGLLLVAPRLPKGLVLDLEGPPVSAAYLRMTVEMMLRAGARVERAEARRLVVAAGSYSAQAIEVEPDWSAAAFLLAGARLSGCQVRIPGLASPETSLQGDSAFDSLARELEQRHPHDLDLTDTPDLIAPIAALAVFASRRTRIRGAAHTRIKESDRVSVLSESLRRLGVGVVEHEDGLEIEPAPVIPGGEIELDPAGDHRMAMAFGVLSLRMPGIRIRTPECVSKSFPEFWTALASIRTARESVDRIESGSEDARRLVYGPALVGLRGAGKSTLAPLIAELCGLDWVDADAELERRTGRSVAEILTWQGEAELRRLERELLLELLERPRVVLATGGGAVLHEEVRSALRRRVTAWLRAPALVLASRVTGSGRPPLTGLPLAEEMEMLASAREPLYREVAVVELDTGAIGPEDAARRVAELWVGLEGKR